MAAAELLEATAGGEDRAGELAFELARRVLDELGGSLASSVLEGGPLTIVRAVRLADLVLRLKASATAEKASTGREP
ncbi:MAG: hypothetical protein ACRENE_10510 [Polyangiaceae bacterium]